MGELVNIVSETNDQIHEVTANEYAYFKRSCVIYQKSFGLVDWDLNFFEDDLSEDAELANISWCFTGHSVRITLSTKMPVCDDYLVVLDYIARHEMIHLLLARIQEYAQRRNVIQEDIDEAIESLVRMIDNVYQVGNQQNH